jgi:hypothetical protein
MALLEVRKTLVGIGSPIGSLSFRILEVDTEEFIGDFILEC